MEILQSGLINTTVAATLSEGTMSERLQKASLNTILGLGTVFTVLILIILLIYLFKLIPFLQNKFNNNANAVASPVDNIIAQIVEQEEEELGDDLELVAVITAAINAAMGETVPTDGFVVRSIRKVNSRRWMNA